MGIIGSNGRVLFERQVLQFEKTEKESESHNDDGAQRANQGVLLCVAFQIESWHRFAKQIKAE